MANLLNSVKSLVLCVFFPQAKQNQILQIKEDVVYIYNGILLSHKKEQNFAICSNMDGLGGHYSKWNKSEKTNTVWYHLYVESKKYNKLVNITKWNRQI